jgi:hypothetical protein
MAKAKCKICGAELDTKTAYKVVTISAKTGKEMPKYYCSKEEWQAEEDRKNKIAEDRNRVYFLICDMFGYEIQNTKFFAEWVLWNKLKSDEIIYKYLRENETYLQQICDKSYNSEYGRIMYFSAVLKNSLKDFKPKAKVVEKPKVVVEEHYETRYKPKARAALLDFEEDCE